MPEHQPKIHEKPNTIEKTIGNIFELSSKNNWLIFGHGTQSIEAARKILQQGLLSKGTPGLLPTFGSTAINVENAEQIKNWPHEKRPYVILIAIPKLPDDYPYEVSGSDYQDMYFESNNTELPTNHKSILPPEYITGYFDVINDKFTPNQALNPIAHYKKPSSRPSTLESRKNFVSEQPETDLGLDNWIE